MPKSQQSWFRFRILRHIGIWGVADEAVLNKVITKSNFENVLWTYTALLLYLVKHFTEYQQTF
jgi:hypothetical protein